MTATTETAPTTPLGSTGPITPAAPLPRPRIRVGAVVWGLVVTAIGAGSLYLLTSPERRQAAVDWVQSLTPFGFVIVGFAALGALIFVIGILVLIRDGQRRRARATEAASDSMGR
jgi:hypothetical protein